MVIVTFLGFFGLQCDTISPTMDVYARGYPPKKRRLPRIFFAILVIGVAVYGLSRSLRPQPVISPIPEEKSQSNSPIFFGKKKEPSALAEQIKKEIGDSWNNYSLYVKDYTSDFSVGVNEEVIYTAASVNKLPILAALYFLAEARDIDLDQSITLQAADIQDFGTGVIRYDAPGTTYSIKTLALLMIQKSDNTAAYILANHVIGITRLQELVTSWGLIQTDIENNKTSNKDIAILFEKIINNKVANIAYTEEMLSFLKKTDFEDRLPAGLPKGVTVYHKIGTEVRTIHDVGIVTDGKVRYYVGIFTTDVDSEEEAVKRIARISKIIYDFMR